MILDFRHHKLKNVKNSKNYKMTILDFQHLNNQNLKSQNHLIFCVFNI